MRLAHPRLRRACGALLLLFGIGCAARPAAVAPPTPPFDPVPDMADITYNDIAEIKAEVLWYYVTKQPENWQAFTVELGRGVYFPPDESGSSLRRPILLNSSSADVI